MVFNCPFHLARGIPKPPKQLPTHIPASPFPLSPLLPLHLFDEDLKKNVPGFPPPPLHEAGYTLVCERLKRRYKKQ